MPNLCDFLYHRRSQYSNQNLFLHDLRSPGSTSFEQFRSKTQKLAGYLQEQKIDHRSRVLISMPLVVECIGFVCALIQLGCNIFITDEYTDQTDLEKICQEFDITIAISATVFDRKPSATKKIFNLTEIFGYAEQELTYFVDSASDQISINFVHQTQDGNFICTNFSHQQIVDAMQGLTYLGFKHGSHVLNMSIPTSDPFGFLVNVLAPFYCGSVHVLVGHDPNYGAINTMLNQLSINLFFANSYALDAVLHHNQHPIVDRALVSTYTVGDIVPQTVWREWKEKIAGELQHILTWPTIMTPVFLPGVTGPKDFGSAWPDVEIQIIDDQGLVSLTGTGRLCIWCNQQWIDTGHVVAFDHDKHLKYLGHQSQIACLNGQTINCLDLEDEFRSIPNVRDCMIYVDNKNELKIFLALWKDHEYLEMPHPSHWHDHQLDYVESIPRNNRKQKTHLR